jgi:uncharacterized membrane protein
MKDTPLIDLEAKNINQKTCAPNTRKRFKLRRKHILITAVVLYLGNMWYLNQKSYQDVAFLLLTLAIVSVMLGLAALFVYEKPNRSHCE